MLIPQTRQQAHEAIAQGNLAAALAYWQHLCAQNPTPSHCLEYLQLLWALYHLADAIPIQHTLLHHPDTTSLQCLSAAKELFALHRMADAAQFTARALTLDPRNPDTAAIHAASLERSGETSQAHHLLIHTLRHHPHHLRSIRLLAHIERIQGALDHAHQRLTSQLDSQQTPEDWRLRYELAPILEKMGDFSGAMETLISAKKQLAQKSTPLYQIWENLSKKQWEITSLIDHACLDTWNQHAHPLQPPMRICLLGGFPRSGTTLLEKILSTHTECIGTDESGILATQFRDPLVAIARDSHSVLAELHSLDAESISAGRSEYLRCTCEHLGETVGSRLLIEKEPLITADLPISLRLFPEAQILIPLRDPRDVVISYFFTMVPLEPNSVASCHLGDTCRYYAEVMRHWLHLREILPPHRWMESRYEDLITYPEQQTRKIAQFLGLSWSSDMLAHHQKSNRRAISTPTYDDVSKPLYTRAINRWHHYQQWLEPHLHHLEPYLNAFGYT